MITCKRNEVILDGTSDELYGEAEEYKIEKQKLIVKLEIVEDYLNSHGVCNGNSTCLC